MQIAPINDELLMKSQEAEQLIAPYVKEVEDIAFYNQRKVLQAFKQNRVSDFHLSGSTGYGYDDSGRDVLEQVYSDVFGAEDCLVRNQIISGTHAITISLFGILRPGDELIYITGKPYDTLDSIVSGNGKDTGSLEDYQISYQHIDLLEGGAVDYVKAKQAISSKTKVVAIQRSKGYSSNPSFRIHEIEEIIKEIRKIKEDVVIFVDNCYGEFVEKQEPTEVGADLMAGSLIKNPGGGLARTGGYIAGRKELVEKCAYRMTSPGLGAEAGASLDTLLEMYQGFFLAPHVVSQAVKGALFTAAFFEQFGMDTTPHYSERRTDLIQSVNFSSAEQMIKFCQMIQDNSPINAHYAPEPSYMPGYSDDVIMAAGTFIQGSSIELTADGPIRPPYTAYIQGGLTYEHVKTAVLTSMEQLLERKLI
ncbi:aminotransferase class I/II-fold pyridoxal phosphate-dependent enzyme [Mammaliicoccus sciuri]|uniref:Aluminum resistance protein n=1 Tax=Sporosarcina newyorkensis 2681 TaxID=1027292 RepID=F9DP29_9BACL|nr:MULTISPECIES: aminotransferase class I/II-fold pyridoxal phosphate-dependent enzyme [Sporosarcina]EGQ27438.1 aluminum resistance protein [Sporosarcina newyorkensis 2681]MBY0221979.1 aminotransferase class I/II-fold pyridoxal phosphate-dependent enzyme [Sporosarcina aquimarina]